jgi:hypothetical protein
VAITKFNGPGTEYVIPETVNGKTIVRINESAFANTGISSVTIPGTVTEIGDYAFANTKLASVAIPSSVTEIGNYAFATVPKEGEENFPPPGPSGGGNPFRRTYRHGGRSLFKQQHHGDHHSIVPFY